MKIIVGYDGSNVAKEALNVAAKHGKAFNASVDIVTSLEGGTNQDIEEQAQKIQNAERELEYAKSLLVEDGIICQTHLLIRGLNPGKDIVQFAEENKADEIIIGIRRRSRTGKLFFGSTAQSVILNAPCPVVSVK